MTTSRFSPSRPPWRGQLEAEKMEMLVATGVPGSLEELATASDAIERRRASLLPESQIGAWIDYVIDMALNIVWRP
jgi:hypothetical protein